ncbi:MAG: VOC family protein, partial [Methyloligellaceae bacterium]
MKNQVAPIEVGICVFDLPAMISFYTDILGFELNSEIPVPADKSDPAGFCAEGYTIVRLQSSKGERIKLVKSGRSPN